jgi:hypothetical protein
MRIRLFAESMDVHRRGLKAPAEESFFSRNRADLRVDVVPLGQFERRRFHRSLSYVAHQYCRAIRLTDHDLPPLIETPPGSHRYFKGGLYEAVGAIPVKLWSLLRCIGRFMGKCVCGCVRLRCLTKAFVLMV